jgi:hypothetical protein
MTRTEQAAFKRLDKRRNDLFVALCIIHTWTTAGFDTPTELLYKISKLVTQHIEEERAAQSKEEGKKC